MGLLQIDTIHVIARSPYLVLWSRLGDYRPEWLDELLAEGALFEYWAHAACFLPIEDYPLHRRRMLEAIQSRSWPVKWAVDWSQQNPGIIERIRSHIQEKGAVRSIEFENKNRPSGGWWNWKEEKDALEALWLTGEVMIARRQNFQRVYDLRERVLPDWEDKDLPNPEEMQRSLTLRAVYALGVAFPAWVSDYYRQPKKGNLQQLEALTGEGLLQRVEVEGLGEGAYVHPDRLGLLTEAASGHLKPTLTTLLSPFDPLVWDRQRARDLFDFDYTIESHSFALTAFMDALGIDSAHFVGYSMGSLYVLDIAERHPERVGKMILISPGGLTPEMPLAVRMLDSSLFGALASRLYSMRTVEKLLRNVSST
jgi:uncharacterized protein YcaQ